MNFTQAQGRLLERIRLKVRNGELTERRFARTVGLSQSHVHKVLKGSSTLSTDALDGLLRNMHLSLLDLCSGEETEEQLSTNPSRQFAPEIPVLDVPIGPGCPWSCVAHRSERFSLPPGIAADDHELFAAHLSPDVEMGYTGQNIAILDLNAGREFTASTVYVVDTGAETLLRFLRRGGAVWYAATREARDYPEKWRSLGELGEDFHVRGTALWSGA